MIKQISALAFFGAVAASEAWACTCPPYVDAASHASGYDFVAIGQVEEVFQLQNDDMAAQYAYEQAYNEALTLYVLDLQDRIDDRTLRQFEEDYATAHPRPEMTSFSAKGDTLTRFSVSKVLKGENTQEILVGSAPAGPPTCGIQYREHASTVVLANKSNGHYSAWMCSIPMFSPEQYEDALSPQAD